jgi:hypothetical protein
MAYQLEPATTVTGAVAEMVPPSGADDAQIQRLEPATTVTGAVVETVHVSGAHEAQIQRLESTTIVAGAVAEMVPPSGADDAQIRRLESTTIVTGSVAETVHVSGADEAQIQRLESTTIVTGAVAETVHVSGAHEAQIQRLESTTIVTGSVAETVHVSGADEAQIQRLESTTIVTGAVAETVHVSVAHDAQIRWQDWQPGLYVDDTRSLRQVYDTLPGAQQDDIPEIVRLLENPASYCAFPGAIALDRHDCVHCILGRGLHSQDEAFVVGFTMGTASDAKEEHAIQFLHFSSMLYPPQYRFKPTDSAVFRLAFDYGFHNKAIARDIHLIPLERQMHRTIADLQRSLGIQVTELLMLYRCEKLLSRQSKASDRLPISLSVCAAPMIADSRL